MITFLSPRGLDPPDRDLQFDYEVWGSAEHEQLHLKREHAADIIRGCMWDLHCQLCQRAAGQWAEVFFAHGVRVLGLASPGTGFCFHCRHGAKHVGRLCTFGSPPVPAATLRFARLERQASQAGQVPASAQRWSVRAQRSKEAFKAAKLDVSAPGLLNVFMNGEAATYHQASAGEPKAGAFAFNFGSLSAGDMALAHEGENASGSFHDAPGKADDGAGSPPKVEGCSSAISSPGPTKLILDSPLGGVDIPKLSLTPQKWASSAKALSIQR
eukprot:s2259_g1.t1